MKLNFIKKIIILSIVLVLCSYTMSNAFSFENKDYHHSEIINIFSNFFNKDKYDLENLREDFINMRNSENYDINLISEKINNISDLNTRSSLENIKNMLLKLQETIGKVDYKEILDKLIDTITSLLQNENNSKIPVEAESIYMDATTAVEFSGKDYSAKLHANIYKHVDENGNEDSDKWVLLIHPFMLNGKNISNTVGPYYYEKGYNIIAPDLRSFGESEGKVALGFLESLDMYDWLTLLNNNYSTSQVIVHGISLGGATTNFLSGIDGFINNGPTKINTQIKSLRELKVVGLVEDCGYTDMTEFANKNFLLNLGIGLNSDNFEYYSNATNSLQYCDLPILIIHGTNDFIVKPENATIVKNTVKGDSVYWSVDGGVHAFIIMGIKSDEYKSNVQNFIDKCNNVQNIENTDSNNNTNSELQNEKNNSENFWTKYLNKFNFFKY